MLLLLAPILFVIAVISFDGKQVSNRRHFLNQLPKYELCLVVLTCNSSVSLHRLISSLEKQTPIGLHSPLFVHVDALPLDNQTDVQTKALLDSVKWGHGGLHVTYSTNHEGSTNQWFSAFPDACDGVVVLEDNAEVGPGYYEWALFALRMFRNNSRFAAASLSCAPPCAAVGNSTVVSNSDVAFFRMIRTPGVVVQRRQWQDFLHWKDKHWNRSEELHIPGSDVERKFRELESVGQQDCSWAFWHALYCQHTSKYVAFYGASHGKTAFARYQGNVQPSLFGVAADNCKLFSKQPPMSKGVPAVEYYDWDGANVFRRWNGMHELIQHALNMHQQHGFVFFMTATHHMLEMVKSFVCNLQLLQLRQKLMIATLDARVCHELAAWGMVVACQVITTTALPSGGGSFAETNYWRQLEFRQVLHSTLLEAGVSVFIVEPDAIWLSNPVNVFPFSGVLHGAIDVAGIIDSLDKKSGIICGCLMLTRGNGRTAAAIRDLWMRVHTASLHPELGFSINEQELLPAVYKSADVAVATAAYDEFPIGLWYVGRNASTVSKERPVVLHNNWLRTVTEKVARAKQFHHWFIDANGSCFDSMPSGYDAYFPRSHAIKSA